MAKFNLFDDGTAILNSEDTTWGEAGVDLTSSLLFYQKGIECYRIPENTVTNKTIDTKWIDPFHATGLFLYLLKTSKNERLSDIFKGYRKRLSHEIC